MMSLLLPGESLASVASALGGDTSGGLAPDPLLAPGEVLESGPPPRGLGRWFLEKWVRGMQTAVDIIEGAHRAKLDPEDFLLGALQRMTLTHAHRDVCRLMKRHYGDDMPPIYWASVPTWDAENERRSETTIPMMLPHEYVAWAPDLDVDAWTAATPAIKEHLGTWKKQVKLDEAGPPVAPMTLWGDTAPYNNGRNSLFLLLWGSMCTFGKRFWLALLPKSQFCNCGCNGLHTIEEIWRIVSWSFAALMAGVMPAVDHAGRAFSDNWRLSKVLQPLPIRGAVLQFRGDWSWLSWCFGVETHMANQMCMLCRACRSAEAPFTDPSLDAAWRSQVWDHESWMRNRLLTASFVSGVFGIPGFRFEMVTLDWMHMCDLGIAQVAMGNILFEAFQRLGGLITKPQKGMKDLVDLLKAAAHDIGSQWPFSSMSIEDIRPADRKPRLRAKAARTRVSVPIVLQFLKEYMTPRSVHERTVLQCMEHLSAMYICLQNWGEGSAAKLAESCRRHLLLFVALARESVDKDPAWLTWRWTPKHHAAIHLTQEQVLRHGNPASYWCYLDEGEIGVAVDVAESVHAKTLAKAAFEKYVYLLAMEREQ